MEKIFSIVDLKANKIVATNPIVIPDWILDALLGLCKTGIEYSGQLICYKNIVEYPFISASGVVGSVFPSKKVVFNDSPDYSTIEFHTHPSALGDMWSKNFSDGDHATFNNRILQEGEQYQHVLITDKNILTWGKYNAPDIRIGFKAIEHVVNNWNDWNAKYNSWKPIPTQPQP